MDMTCYQSPDWVVYVNSYSSANSDVNFHSTLKFNISKSIVEILIEDFSHER